MDDLQPINEEERQKRIAKNAVDAKPIEDELISAGFDIRWISDLFNKRLDYRNAIPILIKWLPIVENQDVKEEIVRALSVPWARGTEAPRLLVDEFRKHDHKSGLRWAIGNALSVVADDKQCDDILELIQDKQYDRARNMLVVALGNMNKSKVEPFLINLLGDEDLVGFAIIALRKIKSEKALPYLEKLQNHPRTWIKNEAKKAVKRLQKG